MTTCSLVKDLIPLVLDKTASEKSRDFVKGHISRCPSCREYYKNAKTELGVSPRTDACVTGDGYGVVAKKIRRRRISSMSVCLGVVALSAVAACLYSAAKK